MREKIGKLVLVLMMTMVVLSCTALAGETEADASEDNKTQDVAVGQQDQNDEETRASVEQKLERMDS